jgi:hypothetical protein
MPVWIVYVAGNVVQLAKDNGAFPAEYDAEANETAIEIEAAAAWQAARTGDFFGTVMYWKAKPAKEAAEA